MKLLFENGGMFDCDRDLKWKIFKDVCYFCAMTTPGGDQNELDARFVSQCATLNINQATDAVAFTIFTSILRGHLADFAPVLHPISDTLIKMTLRLFKVKKKALKRSRTLNDFDFVNATQFQFTLFRNRELNSYTKPLKN